MPHDPRVSYGVAAIICKTFIRGPRVLMIKRKGSHAAGTWSVPGGWVDFGEKAHEAVIREVIEEVGLDVHAGRFFTFREETFVEADVQSATIYFEIQAYVGEPRIADPAKIEELAWIPLDDPKAWPRPLFPGLESALEEFRAKRIVHGALSGIDKSR